MSEYLKFPFGAVEVSAPAGSPLETLCRELRKEFPKLVMFDKTSSWWCRAFSRVLKAITFGKADKFLTGFVTTLKNRVYLDKQTLDILTAEANPLAKDQACVTLLHERIHLRQFKKWGMVLMAIVYIFVFFPVGLAYGRAMIERRAYFETMRATHERNPQRLYSGDFRKWWIEQFIGPSYGWMWPFLNTVAKWYDDEHSMLVAESAFYKNAKEDTT